MEKNIIEIVTILVTILLGIITKKYTNLSSKKIPIQNLLIGIIVAIIEFIITKDFSTAIAFSGLAGGGTYDLIKNLNIIVTGKIEDKIEENRNYEEEVEDIKEIEDIELKEEEE